MDYSVDVNGEYQKVKSKFFRISLLFSLILTAVLVADALLIILSKESYKVQLIIAIVITILFSWFAIYFFVNIYSDVNARYRYFKGYESGLKAVEEVEVLRKGDELTQVNGLYVYPLYIRSFAGLNSQDKIVYFLEEVNYQPGDKLTITTYQKILMKAESHSWTS